MRGSSNQKGRSNEQVAYINNRENTPARWQKPNTLTRLVWSKRLVLLGGMHSGWEKETLKPIYGRLKEMVANERSEQVSDWMFFSEDSLAWANA